MKRPRHSSWGSDYKFYVIIPLAFILLFATLNLSIHFIKNEQDKTKFLTVEENELQASAVEVNEEKKEEKVKFKYEGDGAKTEKENSGQVSKSSWKSEDASESVVNNKDSAELKNVKPESTNNKKENDSKKDKKENAEEQKLGAKKTEEKEKNDASPSQGPRVHPLWYNLEDIYNEFQAAIHEKRDSSLKLSAVRVFLDEQIVAAFRIDNEGNEELVRVFPCSSGHVPGHTPLGQHVAGAIWETPWLFDNAVAQYGIQISGNILFHSLPSYDGSLNSGLKISDLNNMGYAASHGCVRLFCMDAKWLYTYCPTGTPIEVLQNRGTKYSFLPEQIFYLRLKEGAPAWDPSDPDPNNPYHNFATLKKWAVEEPWNKPIEVVPPVWPNFVNFEENSEVPKAIENLEAEQIGNPEETASEISDEVNDSDDVGDVDDVDDVMETGQMESQSEEDNTPAYDDTIPDDITAPPNPVTTQPQKFEPRADYEKEEESPAPQPPPLIYP